MSVDVELNTGLTESPCGNCAIGVLVVTVFWCVKMTHQKPLHCFCMLFFEVLPFTTLASSVNGKLQRKACKNDAAVFGVSRPLGS